MTQDLQGLDLLGAHLARTAAHVEAGQAFHAARFEQAAPAADGVVVEQQNPRHFLTAQAVIQQHKRVGASRQATERRTVASQRAQRLAILFTEKAASNHAASRIPPAEKFKPFFPNPQ